MSEYVKIVSKVVTACADKWRDKGDSNWYTNMYLDYFNNYLTREVFIENEILSTVGYNQDDATEERLVKTYGMKLLELYHAVGHLQPMLSHERVGEICMRVLKGEV